MTGCSITIATYNIHKARGLDRRVDVERIARVVAELDADLVGIQEVYDRQAETLARLLGMHAVMGVTCRRPEGHYGNAVLARMPIREHLCFDLSHGRREPRGGVRVDVDVHGQALHLFNVHFGLSVRERAQQVRLLVRDHILWERRLGPRVLVGDLNEWFPGSVGRTLRREFHWIRRPGRTHPAPLPLFRLDRICWDRWLQGEQVRVHRSALAQVASDHLPVVARLRLPAAARGAGPDDRLVCATPLASA